MGKRERDGVTEREKIEHRVISWEFYWYNSRCTYTSAYNIYRNTLVCWNTPILNYCIAHVFRKREARSDGRLQRRMAAATGEREKNIKYKKERIIIKTRRTAHHTSPIYRRGGRSNGAWYGPIVPPTLRHLPLGL